MAGQRLDARIPPAEQGGKWEKIGAAFPSRKNPDAWDLVLDAGAESKLRPGNDGKVRIWLMPPKEHGDKPRSGAQSGRAPSSSPDGGGTDDDIPFDRLRGEV